MNKLQASDYLENGHIVKLRSGREYLFLDVSFGRTSQFFVGKTDDDGWEDLEDYDEDLKYDDIAEYMREFDVVEIFRPDLAMDYRKFFTNEAYSVKSVWKRAEDDVTKIGIAEVKFAHPLTEENKDKIYLFEIPYGSVYKVGTSVLVNTCHGSMEAIVCGTHLFNSKEEFTEYMKKYPKATLPLRKVASVIYPVEW